MTQIVETAPMQMSVDSTWDPEFLSIVIGRGLGAALVLVAERHDLDEEEVLAVRATIEGLISGDARAQ